MTRAVHDRRFRRADDTLRTALVTGACSGIGRAVAERLASLGYDLVLVSQRPAELGDAARRLAKEAGVKTHCIVVDLARAGAAAELIAGVDALGVDIDIFVSNAGVFFFGEAVDADPGLAERMLELHVVTPSLLCAHFARSMRARRRGYVLIVSSISAFRDFPGIAHYASSKKYLLGFARSLRSELDPYGVGVTCVAPGATATDLYDPSVIDVKLGLRLGIMMRPDAVADAALAAMFAHEAVCIPGWFSRAMTAVAVAVPQFVIDAVRRRAPWLRPR